MNKLIRKNSKNWYSFSQSQRENNPVNGRVSWREGGERERQRERRREGKTNL